MRRTISKTWHHGDVQYMYRTARYKLLRFAVQMVAGFAVVWYLGNRVSKTFLGDFQFLVSLLGTLAVFSLSGMHDALMRSIALGFEGSLVRAAKLVARCALISSGVLGVYAAYAWWIQRDGPWAAALFVCALALPFWRAFLTYDAYLSGGKRFGRECLVTSILFLTQAFLSLSVIWYAGPVLWAFMAVYLGTAVVLSGVYFAFSAREIQDTRTDPELVRLALINTSVGACAIVANNIDKLLVGAVISSEVLATYFIGAYIFTKSRALLHPVLAVFAPRFADGSMALTGKKLVAVSLVGIVLVPPAFLVATVAIPILFPDYPESILLGQCFSFLMAFVPINWICAVYFRATKQERAIIVPTITARSVMIVCCVPGLLLGGLVGLIAVRVVEQAVTLALNLHYWNQQRRHA